MPIYEYACSRCGEVFEELVLRRPGEDAIGCPACRSLEVTRVMSRTAAPRSGASGGSSGGPPPSCGPVG